MINDNIKKYRRKKGLTQEEMAKKLHVVRQTVSKWETGKSVPDAEVLIRMAEVLDVSVNELLGIESVQGNMDEVAEELIRVKERLEEQNRREILTKKVDEKRGIILLLSFASMLAALCVNHPLASILLSTGCILVAALVLYRNLPLMTSITTEDMRLRVLRITTIFNIGILIAAIVLAVFMELGILQFSEQEEKITAIAIVVCIMIFMGIVSPKLPFTRHTGLRLPWTVRDQDTWNLAHRVLGYISIPLALLYTACSLTIDSLEQVTLIIILLWIGIPGGISYIFYWKKMHGKL